VNYFCEVLQKNQLKTICLKSKTKQKHLKPFNKKI